MGELIKQLGMVLSSQPIGDYDKRLVVLTRDKGKLAVFARGARKMKSPLLACCQTFAFGTFSLYEGRNSYNLQGAEITQFFPGLQTDWEAVCYASYFAEYAEYFTRENVEAVDILKLLYQSFRALEKGTIDKSLIRYIFELRIYQCNGEAPDVFDCVKCRKSQTDEKWEPMLYLRKGGLICPDCIQKQKNRGFVSESRGTAEVPPDAKAQGGDGIFLQEAELYAMRYILTSPIETLYNFKLSEEVFARFAAVMEEYRKNYVSHSFHSLENLF